MYYGTNNPSLSGVADVFQGLISTAADLVKQRDAAKQAARELAAQRAFQLQQTAPQMIAQATPGGGLGIVAAAGAVILAMMLLKGKR